jgi:hypothetical protein
LQSPRKICPRCKAVAELHAQFCASCGRQFQSQFPGSQPDRTQLVPPPPAPEWAPAYAPPPPARRSSAGAWIVIGVLGSLLIGACIWSLTRALSAPRASFTAAPAGGGTDSVVGGGPFREVPTQQEQPEILVIDQTGQPYDGTTLVLIGDQTYTLELRPPTASLRLPAGSYRYELRGRAYQATGELDQYGTLTCRRFRRYELPLVLVGPGELRNPHQDLGD